MVIEEEEMISALIVKKFLGNPKIWLYLSIVFLLFISMCKINHQISKSKKRAIESQSEKNIILSYSIELQMENAKLKAKQDLRNKCELTDQQLKELDDNAKIKYFDTCSMFSFSK